MAGPMDENELAFVEAKCRALTPAEIALALHRAVSTIREHLRKRGLPQLNNGAVTKRDPDGHDARIERMAELAARKLPLTATPGERNAL